MSAPPTPSRRPPDDAEDDSIPVGRLAMWALLAAILAVGIALYFRYQPAIAALNDKAH